MVLAVGDEELLVERALTAAVSAARARDPEAELADLAATSLGPGELDELLSPSLFGGQRVVVLRGVHELGKGMAAEVRRVLGSLDSATVVLTAAGGARG